MTSTLDDFERDFPSDSWTSYKYGIMGRCTVCTGLKLK